MIETLPSPGKARFECADRDGLSKLVRVIFEGVWFLIRLTDPRSPEADGRKKEDWVLSEQLVEFVDRDLVKEVFEHGSSAVAHIVACWLIEHIPTEWEQRKRGWL